MYHYIITASSNPAAEEVSDILANPQAINPYDVLKATLLKRTAASERSHFQQLLCAEELGDRRPTQLLRRMTQLLGDRAYAVSDVLLRELFLQRLPANVQMGLAAAGIMDLFALAALADAVMKVAVPSISAVANLTSTGVSAATPACTPS